MIRTVEAETLEQQTPNAGRVDCGKEVHESKQTEVWTVVDGMSQCQKCSKHEGLY